MTRAEAFADAIRDYEEANMTTDPYTQTTTIGDFTEAQIQRSVDPASHTQVAHTNIDQSYPGYLNLQFSAGAVVLTMRGDPVMRSDGTVEREGTTTALTLLEADWDVLLARAAHARNPRA